MVSRLDGAQVLHARFAVTAPEGVIPQPHGSLAAETVATFGEHADVAGLADERPLGLVGTLDAGPAKELHADDDIAAVDDDLVVELPTQRGRAAAEVEALWADFKTSGSQAAREDLILHYAPLVSAVAGRVGMRLPSTVEQADLVSYGMFGLIDAIEKYQTDRSVKFESYASARIRGAIIDELRAMDWVPRSVRTKARSLDRAYAELEARLHRAPTEREVAHHLQISVGELRAIFSQLATVNVAALDELLGGGGDERPGGVSLVDTLGDERSEDPAGTVEAAETKFLLARAIEHLGERERIVVVLYYFEGMTLAEIGRVLGVTESRISQMHTSAMLRLRTRLLDADRA